jgi:hypothetical protein
MTLVVAPCSHAAAVYAVEHWHYSQRIPRSKLVKFGVWEDEQFIGAIIYGSGANSGMLAPYGLDQTEGCELLRVALHRHSVSVSQVVAESLRQLKRMQPGLRMVVSFADPDKGHRGGIYQAGNWLYLGMTSAAHEFIVNGRRIHGRALRGSRKAHRLGNIESANVEEWARTVLDPNIEKVFGSSKHRYVYPLDKQMRRRLIPLAQSYPHAVEVSTVRRLDPVQEVQVQLLPTAPILDDVDAD